MKTTIEWLQTILTLSHYRNWELHEKEMISRRCDFITDAPNYVPENKLTEECIALAKGIFSDMRTIELSDNVSIKDTHRKIFNATLIRLESLANRAIDEIKNMEK